MSILNEIIENKRAKISEAKQRLPAGDMKKCFLDRQLTKSSFLKTLNDSGSGIKIIAEIKKSSPSKGDILKPDEDIVDIAKLYRLNGSSCLSLVTEESFFRGSIWDVKRIKEAVTIPVLRKDFIVDEYQLYESKYFKADCVLLIARILDEKELKRFSALARDLEMDTLFEIHDKEDMDKVMKCNPRMIGVNNRDIDTLDVDLKRSEQLIPDIPDGILRVSESGIKNYNDILYLKSLGADAFLIGETILLEQDRAKKIRELLGYDKG
ncbi:MAG: indole-3-glycerol phosphate synthase TrpC [Candidatus Omnitrophica bacterium]|nr:indole-3-glycerol phosphate synthase TrpC [Candidatus Omnitrophota bacterium]